MAIAHEDLVGYALGALGAEESARVAVAVGGDPALADELGRIERHLRIHDATPRIEPSPALWESIRARLDEAPAPPVPLLRRFWMPAAAAALVALAFLLPRDSRPPAGLLPLHGRVVRAADGSYLAPEVARVLLGPGGATVTIDADTAFEVVSPRRLALRAGRLFLQVPPEQRGFAVLAGDLVAVTTGTAFLVERRDRTFVWAEEGRVRCSSPAGEREIGAGEAFFATGEPPLAMPRSPRAWFERPELVATLLDERTVRVEIRNRMPDPIALAPATGGEPLLFATYLGHDFPLAPDDFRALTLEPGAAKVLELPLPEPVPEGATLVVAYPACGIRAEARR